jgi:hypothetical protein
MQIVAIAVAPESLLIPLVAGASQAMAITAGVGTMFGGGV